VFTRIHNRLRCLLVGACVLAGSIFSTAHAQPAEKPVGMPMWVIRDDDSTIYITGTVHLLPDHAEWRDVRLEAAFAEAHELWLEVAEIGDPEALQRELEPLFEAHASWDGPPLSSKLGPIDTAKLHEELALAGATPEFIARTEIKQPWFATFALGREDYFGGDHKNDNGIDINLARMAKARGIPVRGLETVEDQILLGLGMTYEQQIIELRSRLHMPPNMKAMMGRVADTAFGGWVRGETNMIGALQVFMLTGLGRESYDALLRDRNETWADTVEEILDGSGVSFIGVGAAHLVGPDSLPTLLTERGLEVSRY
jgi:uncharacterized protein YbaP (TraB family)